MERAMTAGYVGRRGFALRSVQDGAARVSLVFGQGAVEVLEVELRAGGSLAEPALWGGTTWHMVLEGQAVVRQGERQWELLPSETLFLGGDAPYMLVNPTPGVAKLLTLRMEESGVGEARGRRTMTTKQKLTIWGIGILLWVNVLSIVLSVWRFGWVDWGTVGLMGLIMVPPLAAGAALLFWYRARGERGAPRVSGLPELEEAPRLAAGGGR